MIGRSPALDNLPPVRRFFAYGAVLGADAISAAAVHGTARSGRTLLVAFANLGDQLRFMNVWSRYAPDGATFDVACNTPTRAAFELFDCVGGVTEFENQGAASLPKSAAVMFGRNKPYAVACVPHPFFSRPIAAAYARTHAARVVAIEGRGASGDAIVPLDRSSWRAAYEAFARACFTGAAPRRAPRLRSGLGLEYAGAGSRRVALHPATSAPARTLAPEQFSTLARKLAAAGFEVCVLGSASEESSLRTAFSGTAVAFACGAPLAEVGALLARCGAFVGIDSSMMQLADTIGVPSAVIYTATSRDVAGPFYASSVAIVPSRAYVPANVEPEASWTGDRDAARHVDLDEIVAAVAKLTV